MNRNNLDMSFLPSEFANIGLVSDNARLHNPLKLNSAKDIRINSLQRSSIKLRNAKKTPSRKRWENCKSENGDDAPKGVSRQESDGSTQSIEAFKLKTTKSAPLSSPLRPAPKENQCRWKSKQDNATSSKAGGEAPRAVFRALSNGSTDNDSVVAPPPLQTHLSAPLQGCSRWESAPDKNTKPEGMKNQALTVATALRAKMRARRARQQQLSNTDSTDVPDSPPRRPIRCLVLSNSKRFESCSLLIETAPPKAPPKLHRRSTSNVTEDGTVVVDRFTTSPTKRTSEPPRAPPKLFCRSTSNVNDSDGDDKAPKRSNAKGDNAQSPKQRFGTSKGNMVPPKKPPKLFCRSKSHEKETQADQIAVNQNNFVKDLVSTEHSLDIDVDESESDMDMDQLTVPVEEADQMFVDNDDDDDIIKDLVSIKKNSKRKCRVDVGCGADESESSLDMDQLTMPMDCAGSATEPESFSTWDMSQASQDMGLDISNHSDDGSSAKDPTKKTSRTLEILNDVLGRQ